MVLVVVVLFVFPAPPKLKGLGLFVSFGFSFGLLLNKLFLRLVWLVVVVFPNKVLVLLIGLRFVLVLLVNSLLVVGLGFVFAVFPKILVGLVGFVFELGNKLLEVVWLLFVNKLDVPEPPPILPPIFVVGAPDWPSLFPSCSINHMIIFRGLI